VPCAPDPDADLAGAGVLADDLSNVYNALSTVDNTPSSRFAEPRCMPATDLLQGTLDLLILKVLSLGPLHGWAISSRIHAISNQLLEVNQGSLYPAMHRLEGEGLLTATWGLSETARRVRFYRLTRSGRARLMRETRNWRDYTRAVDRILDTSR
jgi:PadR family transcriptional regulator PadR